MKSPNDVITDTVRRVSDIIWWNRGLTQLTNEKWFSNGREFVSHLLQAKGPFVEHVRPPAKQSELFLDFCKRLGVDQGISEAFGQLLFRGDASGRLFKHQAETIEEIISSATRDVILSVPTATGKTESFLLPVLDYCAKDERTGLKAILVYPLKTLEIDQLNRMIRVLDEFNRKVGQDRKIEVGIWDGDTPESVGTEDSEGAVTEGSPMRGIICPRCGEKMRIGRDDALRCDSHQQFYWVRVTRKTIRRAASQLDVLITNPESLDFLMINKDDDVREMVGVTPGVAPVKFIVFDEAHVWRGISGSHLHLLIRRLRAFYEKSKPKVVLVSATIGDPAGFAQAILGHDRFRSIGFTPTELPTPLHHDFSRVKACTFRDLCEVILRSVTTESLNLAERRPWLANALEMAKRMNLIETGEFLNLTETGKIVLNLMDPPRVAVDEAIDYVIANLSNSLEFLDLWQTILFEKLPEVFVLSHFFKIGDSAIAFEGADVLARSIASSGSSQIGTEQAESILACLLSFGRSANLLLDKYHMFLRPLSEVFWCPNDKLLSEKFICPQCGEAGFEIRTCPQCHHPFVIAELDPEEKQDQQDEGKDATRTDDKDTDEDQDERLSVVPIEEVSKDRDLVGVGACVQCAEPLYAEDMQDPWVHYTTFVSYLLSALCREGGSTKVLVFSDGRISSESIAQRVVDLDYSLVAQQLYVAELLRQPGHRRPQREAMFEIIKQLKEYYTSFMEDAVSSEDSRQIVRRFFESNVLPKAFLDNLRQLLNFGIVTAIEAYDRISSTYDLILTQELIRMFHIKGASFRYRNVPMRGLTWDRLVDRLSSRFAWDKASIEARLPQIVRTLIDANVLTTEHPDAIHQVIQESIQKAKIPDSERVEPLLIAYITEAGNNLKRILKWTEAKGPLTGLLMTPDYRATKIQFQLGLVPFNVICLQCRSVWPAREKDVTKCPICHGPLHYGSRLTGDSPLGYLPTPVDDDRPLDHWGNDIVRVALEAKGNPVSHIVTWVHRAGIRPDIRGAIEEGFRRTIPRINVISSTPTLELGVDIGSLDAVVQIGIPPTLTNYIQRSGRTGRMRGKPSYVFSIMRNDHSVDMYYFNDLKSYFRSIKPINIPRPEDYLPVQAPHVATETCAYLSRALPQHLYARIFTVDDVHQLGNFSSEVLQRILALVQLATRTDLPYSTGLRNYLKKVFGDLRAFEEVFESDGPLSLVRRAHEVFGRLGKVRNADMSLQYEYTEKNKTLGSWLALMGFIAAYRGIGGGRIPLVLTGPQQSEIEVKSEDRIISENYPGPKNERGAMFYVQTVRFLVQHATGGPKLLLETAICQNYKKCPLPGQPYPLTLESCPLCNTHLGKVAIYNIDQVVPILARRQSYITSPIISANCSVQEAREGPIACNFGILPTEAILGRMHTVTFTAAFRRSGSRYGQGHIYPSEAEIRLPAPNPEDSSEFDVEKWMEVSGSTLKAPLGFEDFTEGVVLTVSRTRLAEHLPEGNRALIAACVSFAQALRRSVALVAQVEMNDFSVHWSLDNEVVKFFILDGRSGGNGVSRLISNDITRTAPTLVAVVRETVNCPNKCLQFCDACLLLERTPEHIITNGFLDRRLLGAIMGL